MKNICLLLIALIPIFLSAQSKRGDRWTLGYCGACRLPDQPANTDIYGGISIVFNNGIAELSHFDIFSKTPLAVANDIDGNLAFYSTGCAVFSKNMEVMENGSDLPDPYYDEYCSEDIYSLDGIRGGFLVLPQPEHDDHYYYFRTSFNDVGKGRFVCDRLLLTEVDITANNGLGKVTNRNETIISDSLVCSVTAVKHGNGRDWWIVIPRGTNFQFWTILLTPDGLQTPVLQTLPPPYTPFTKTIEVYDPQTGEKIIKPADEYYMEAENGQADFSPDGNWYARVIPNGGELEIFHFNRCEGRFSHSATVPTLDNEITSGAGLSFSPDSRFIYYNNGINLYQLSLSPESLKKPEPVYIGVFDGYAENNVVFNFFQMRTAPDGKIYMGAGNTSRFLHVIENPNAEGRDCNFKQRGFPTGRHFSFSINYFPNFNLYEAPYGLCDSLGIDITAASGDYPFAVLPNPVAGSTLTYYIPQCSTAQISVWNTAGQLLRQIDNPKIFSSNALDISDFPAGVYFVGARLDDQPPVVKEVLVVR